jgi:hypothetical protein
MALQLGFVGLKLSPHTPNEGGSGGGGADPGTGILAENSDFLITEASDFLIQE